jgi:hypothetical protein
MLRAEPPMEHHHLLADRHRSFDLQLANTALDILEKERRANVNTSTAMSYFPFFVLLHRT